MPRVDSAGLAFGRENATEWMEQLRRVGRRNWLVKPVFAGHPAARHVQSSKQDIKQRQLTGKVFVAGFRVPAVVPMMKLRRGEQPPERPKIDAHVGVNQHRLPSVQYHVRADGSVGEAERKYRQQRKSLRYNLIQRMDAGGGKPVEFLDAVVDRMEPPQPGYRVKRAMGEVEPDVGKDYDLEEWDPIRLPRGGGPHRLRHQPASRHYYADD